MLEKMESIMLLQPKQLDWESTEPEKDTCTSIDGGFVAECSSGDNSIDTPAPSETSRSSAQRRPQYELVSSHVPMPFVFL